MPNLPASAIGSGTFSAALLPNLSSSYVALAGSTMTGALNLPSNGLSVGSNQLAVSSGNVGIGTATAAKTLQVYGNNTNDISIRVTNGASSAGDFALGAMGPASYLPGGFSLWNVTSSSAPFNVTAAGNIGLSTTAPSEVLDVVGNLHLGPYRQINGSRTMPTTVGQEVDIGSFTMAQGAGEFRITVAVGDLNFTVTKQYVVMSTYSATGAAWMVLQPLYDTGLFLGQNFDVDYYSSGWTQSFRIRRTAGSNAGTAYFSIDDLGTATNTFAASTATAAVATPAAYYTGNVQTTTGGSIGIGTTAPAAFLDVVRSGTNDPLIRAMGPNATDNESISVVNASGSTSLSMFTAGNAGAFLSGTALGDVGIRRVGTGNFYFGTANTSPQLTVTGSGNVGIGTTVPTDKLQVAGNIILSSGNNMIIPGGLKAHWYAYAPVTTSGATISDTSVWGRTLIDSQILTSVNLSNYAINGSGSYAGVIAGFVQPAYTETYTFSLTCDDGCSLFVNGTQLINAWVTQAATTYSGTYAATAGVWTPIYIEHYQGGGSEQLTLTWSSAHQSSGLISGNSLGYAPGPLGH